MLSTSVQGTWVYPHYNDVAAYKMTESETSDSFKLQDNVADWLSLFCCRGPGQNHGFY